jgi:hypothetical protein
VYAGVPAPMLARLESALPRGSGWCYEPKLDGFRGLLWRSESGAVRLLRRNLKDLSLPFPELARAAQSLPRDTVLDGEIVIADEHGNADFGALQQRLRAGKHGAADAAQRRPAVLLIFDLPRVAGVDAFRSGGNGTSSNRPEPHTSMSSSASSRRLIGSVAPMLKTWPLVASFTPTIRNASTTSSTYVRRYGIEVQPDDEVDHVPAGRLLVAARHDQSPACARTSVIHPSRSSS